MIDAIVDVSHWQHPVDFGALHDSGVKAVILKATQGSHWVDATFTKKLLGAHEAGLLIGAYHFADDTSPATQATHFLTVAGSVPLLAIDIEPNHMGGTVTVSGAAEIAARVHSALARSPKIYIGKYGPDDKGGGLPNLILARCDLWVPKYGPTIDAHHDLPAGWTSWMLWQHTRTGKVDGYTGNIDRSYFCGTGAELEAWWST